MLGANQIRTSLETVIDELATTPEQYVKRPGKDFTRNRKLGLASLSRLLLTMQGSSISNELERYFQHSEDTPTASAFVQQRGKIDPEFFHEMLHRFNARCNDTQNYRGYRLYAVDGTCLNVARNETVESFVRSPSSEGYNFLHISALYDISNGVYQDCVIQPATKANERADLIAMLKTNSFPQKSIIILDRGYQGYHLFAHLKNTPNVDFVCRVIQGERGFRHLRNLPMTELDTYIHPELTTTQTNEDKRLKRVLIHLPGKKARANDPSLTRNWDFPSPYQMHLRVVRFRIADKPGKDGKVETNPDNYETILTSLTPEEFPLAEIKKLYAARWGVETSFRTLKYAVGLVNLHAKNEEFVRQEIYAHFIMYNFFRRVAACTMVVRKEEKYEYQVNLTAAFHLCRAFYLGLIDAVWLDRKLRRYVLPVRPGRQDKRKMNAKTFVSFLYRVAA